MFLYIAINLSVGIAKIKVMITKNYHYINLESLKAATFNDAAIQQEIMGLFLELIDEYITTLNNELPKKNWNALFKATHKIKPNVSMFGIQALELTILKLDADFRNEQNLDTINAHVDTCIRIFSQVKTEIETELKLKDNAQEKNYFS